MTTWEELIINNYFHRRRPTAVTCETPRILYLTDFAEI